jgi:hypothetical protein
MCDFQGQPYIGLLINSVITQELRRDAQLQCGLQNSCGDECSFIGNHQDRLLQEAAEAREAAAQD